MGAAGGGLQEPPLKGSWKEIPQTDGLTAHLTVPSKSLQHEDECDVYSLA